MRCQMLAAWKRREAIDWKDARIGVLQLCLGVHSYIFYNFGVVNLNKINLTVFCSVRITVHIEMAEEKMEVVRMDILSVSVMKRVVEYSQGCSFTVRVIVHYNVLTVLYHYIMYHTQKCNWSLSLRTEWSFFTCRRSFGPSQGM